MKKVMLLASEEFCEVLCDELREVYMVFPCSNERDAQKALLMEPDALVLNLFLPGMDSLEFLRTYTAILPQAVIALTPLINQNLLMVLSGLEITCLLRIPFRFDELKKQLSASLAKKEASPDKRRGKHWTSEGYSGVGTQKPHTIGRN